MIRILYFSRSTNALYDDQLEDILESSRRNNSALGITGILVHANGMFMQVLEGPEQPTLRTYVKILDDQRHSDCQIAYIAHTDKRIFEGWSMGAIARNDPLDFEKIIALQKQHRKAVVEPKIFIQTIREWLTILKDKHG
ncbi:BLUF domain-containing protein [Methylobacter sp. G7]|uniref:BLUF domain-containing protein n=1 Tax=Methylobacter sp. G7 TaxID=3230117 RepID=UPI003D803092